MGGTHKIKGGTECWGRVNPPGGIWGFFWGGKCGKFQPCGLRSGGFSAPKSPILAPNLPAQGVPNPVSPQYHPSVTLGMFPTYSPQIVPKSLFFPPNLALPAPPMVPPGVPSLSPTPRPFSVPVFTLVMPKGTFPTQSPPNFPCKHLKTPIFPPNLVAPAPPACPLDVPNPASPRRPRRGHLGDAEGDVPHVEPSRLSRHLGPHDGDGGGGDGEAVGGHGGEQRGGRDLSRRWKTGGTRQGGPGGNLGGFGESLGGLGGRNRGLGVSSALGGGH